MILLDELINLSNMSNLKQILLGISILFLGIIIASFHGCYKAITELKKPFESNDFDFTKYKITKTSDEGIGGKKTYWYQVIDKKYVNFKNVPSSQIYITYNKNNNIIEERTLNFFPTNSECEKQIDNFNKDKYSNYKKFNNIENNKFFNDKSNTQYYNISDSNFSIMTCIQFFKNSTWTLLDIKKPVIDIHKNNYIESYYGYKFGDTLKTNSNNEKIIQTDNKIVKVETNENDVISAISQEILYDDKTSCYQSFLGNEKEVQKFSFDTINFYKRTFEFDKYYIDNRYMIGNTCIPKNDSKFLHKFYILDSAYSKEFYIFINDAKLKNIYGLNM